MFMMAHFSLRGLRLSYFGMEPERILDYLQENVNPLGTKIRKTAELGFFVVISRIWVTS